MKIETIGLLGFGRFGRMAYRYLRRDFSLAVFDADSGRTGELPEGASFQEAVACQLILLCVPISEVESVCRRMAPLITYPIVVDTCSVKSKPVEWMLQHLPKSAQILGTHPLFGPDSGREGIAGLKVALCPARIEADSYACVRDYLRGLELIPIETTPEEHDRQIARSQAVFHLIAQAVKKLGWQGQHISTPGPEAFYRLVATVQNDTEQLFLDMERQNPHARGCREQLLRELEALNLELGEGK